MSNQCLSSQDVKMSKYAEYKYIYIRPRVNKYSCMVRVLLQPPPPKKKKERSISTFHDDYDGTIVCTQKKSRSTPLSHLGELPLLLAVVRPAAVEPVNVPHQLRRPHHLRQRRAAVPGGGDTRGAATRGGGTVCSCHACTPYVQLCSD